MKGLMMLTATMLLLGFVYLAAVEKQEKALDRKHWCEMVKEHIDTKGEYGWPDDGSYEEECR